LIVSEDSLKIQYNDRSEMSKEASELLQKKQEDEDKLKQKQQQIEEQKLKLKKIKSSWKTAACLLRN
jgi:Arc/MetJ-type ribon-helix-helix transcriptional regulator